MKVLHRQIQHVRPAQWAELEALDKRFDAVEARLGFPANKRRYHCIFGAHLVNTLIVEYEWESLAKLEAVLESALADPEWQALSTEIGTILKDNQMELYVPL